MDEVDLTQTPKNILKKYKILIVVGIILILIICYLFYLQIVYSNYQKYDDSSNKIKYDGLVSSFNNLEKYYLKYETKSPTSQISEIYYLKDKMFFQIRENDEQRVINIMMPERSGMGLIKKKDFNGECKIINEQTWPIPLGDNECLFELGITHTTMDMPATFILHSPDYSNNSAFLMGGKMYGYEESINRISSFCVYSKYPERLVSYNLLARMPQFLSFLTKILMKLPPRIVKSGISCYSDKGVLISTDDGNLLGRTRTPLALKYEFDNSFLNELPYYLDFEKLIQKLNIKTDKYYEITIGEDKTYFKDLDNYLNFNTFEGKESLISGCSNGINVIDSNQQCYTQIAPPYSFRNESLVPIKFEENKNIAGQNTDCFSQSTTGRAVDIKKEFCMMSGGYIVYEKEYRTYKIDSGPAEVGYEASSIKEISSQEYQVKLLS